MSGAHLTGLEGTNPLGFLAALGIQVAFATEAERPRLWWSDDIVPHAVVDKDFTTERIASQAMTVFAQWKDSPAVNPRRSDGSPMPKGDELKLTTEDTRTYLSLADQSDSWSALITALLAEGSLDRKGDVAKPSDLYLTAGREIFLDTARKILGGVSPDDVLTGLQGPWSYKSKLPSLRWDVSDDRVYALRANDPALKSGPDPKRTNPGPEALSILGLSLYPVFGSHRRTLTQGCSGAWTASTYSWPLWHKPSTSHVVKSLLAHAYQPADVGRHRWLRSWGVFRILRSSINRHPNGGRGTFAPSEVGWQA